MTEVHTPALSGVRICDFTGQLAGAGATRWLAAFGAEVIRIEDPVNEGRWDLLRGSAPYVDDRRGINLGGSFNNHNVGKRGITLNLREPRAKEILRDIIALSDVVTENFAAGVLVRWGFGFEELRAIKEDIIYVSNCGYSHSGPFSSFRTWGPVVQANCGLAFYSGLPEMAPAGWGYSYMDHVGGYLHALAILSALIERDRTGTGKWVDLSTVEAGAGMLGPVLLNATVNRRPVRREGSPHTNRSQFPMMCPHGVYPCEGEDNWVSIACRNDDDWSALSSVLDVSAVTDGDLSDVSVRLTCEDELDQRIAAWTQSMDKFDVEALLQKAGVPSAAVQKPFERIEHDANTAQWGLWQEVEHPEIGRVRVEGLPVHLSETDWSITKPAPCLGQHTDEVLHELLGLGTEELAALHAAGVL